MEPKPHWGLKWSYEGWEGSSHWAQSSEKHEEQKVHCWGPNSVVLKANREKQDDSASVLFSLSSKVVLRLERLEQICLVGNWNLT